MCFEGVGQARQKKQQCLPNVQGHCAGCFCAKRKFCINRLVLCGFPLCFAMLPMGWLQTRLLLPNWAKKCAVLNFSQSPGACLSKIKPQKAIQIWRCLRSCNFQTQPLKIDRQPLCFPRVCARAVENQPMPTKWAKSLGDHVWSKIAFLNEPFELCRQSLCFPMFLAQLAFSNPKFANLRW